MLASSAADIKFHSWDIHEYLGCVKSPDYPRYNKFFDISWCNDGKKMIAVPTSGQPFIINTNAPISFNKEQFNPSIDVLNINDVRCACYSTQNNSNIALGTTYGKVLLYNNIHRKVTCSLSDLSSEVNIIKFGKQDSFIVAGCINGIIYLYADGIKPSVSYIISKSGCLTALNASSRIPEYLAAGTETGLVSIWDVSNDNIIMKTRKHSGPVVDMEFSHLDDSFMTVGTDRMINMYDIRTLECVHVKEYQNALTSLAFSPNGIDVAVATDRGEIITLDRRYLNSYKNSSRAHKNSIKKISFNLFHRNMEECDYPEDKSNWYQEMPPFLHSIEEYERKMPPSPYLNIYETSSDESVTEKSKASSINSDKKCQSANHDLKLLASEIKSSINEITNNLTYCITTGFDDMQEFINREFSITKNEIAKDCEKFMCKLEELRKEEPCEVENLTKIVTRTSSTEICSEVRPKIKLKNDIENLV